MNENPNSPAKVIKQMLEQRNWTQTDLAFFLGWGSSEVSQLLTQKKNFTLKIARDLAVVFDTTPDYWLDIHRKYELAKLEEADADMITRVNLFKNFPIKEMHRRNWIEPTEDLEIIKKQILDYFEIPSLNAKPSLLFAARKSSNYSETTIEQAAWIRRANKLSKAVLVKQFSITKLENALEDIKSLLFEAEEIRHIPKILAEAGIRFVVVEPIPKSKIDGACFWINKHSPVIALSLRFDRVDNFWHTLLHECSHVLHLEGQNEPLLDVDLSGETQTPKPEIEIRADTDAAEFSIPKAKLDSFILRTHPSYTKDKLMGFSALNKVNVGILVGQLQNRFKTTGKGIPFSYHRELLIPIRHIITSTALTDGYGHQPII